MDELIEYNQWCVCRDDKIPRNLSGDPISVWNDKLYSFSTAAAYAHENGCYFGFILRKEDPFSCIDLDVKDDTDERRLAFFRHIVEQFNSYTEVSKSGKGIHIWVKGNIGKGRRRDGVEIYSQERFIICTGKKVNGSVIEERQELLDALAGGMGPPSRESTLQEMPQVMEDQDVLDRCSSELFNNLWQGKYEGYIKENGEPRFDSASAADMGLMNILVQHSPSDSQCRRLFLMSELGKREKIQARPDYLINGLLGEARSVYGYNGSDDTNEFHEDYGTRVLAPVVENIIAKQFGVKDEKPKLPDVKADSLYPPGLLGELAKYFYHASALPVKEFSIATAIAIVAGLAGKAYNINKDNLTGLNMYLVVVAKSATGKETMRQHIGHIVSEMLNRKKRPDFSQFFMWDGLASMQAITRILIESPCGGGLHAIPEVGDLLHRMGDKKDSLAQQMQTFMKDAYTSSGKYSVLRGIQRSKKEESIEGLQGINYTMLGDTTPQTCYACFTPELIENGFTSRITFIEYVGSRPSVNPNIIKHLPAHLLEQFDNLLTVAKEYISLKKDVKFVNMDTTAEKVLKEYELECSANINSTQDELLRQTYNRAHLKAWRLAALIAVFNNPRTPVISQEDAEYAIKFISDTNTAILSHIRKEELGAISDNTREQYMIHHIARYKYKKLKAHAHKELQEDGYISHSEISRICSSAACFRKHNLGTARAVKDTEQNLCDLGVLKLVDEKAPSLKKLPNGRIFRILNSNLLTEALDD